MTPEGTAECLCSEFIETGACGHSDAEHDAMAEGTADGPDVAALLAEELSKHHAGMGQLPQQRGSAAQQGGLRCSCGGWSAPQDDAGLRPWKEFWLHVGSVQAAAVERILADRLAAVTEQRDRYAAQAWDEGYDAGDRVARAVNPEWPDGTSNPYRAALRDGGGGE